MYDPIEMPYNCGESDCPVQWHMSLFDDEDGPMIGDTDGNWEPTDSMPTPDEQRKAWQDYWQHCAETGEDPLHQIYPRLKRVRERWRITLAKSIIGIKVIVSRLGKTYHGSNIPERLRIYCDADEKGIFRGDPNEVPWWRPNRLRSSSWVTLEEWAQKAHPEQHIRRVARKTLRRWDDNRRRIGAIA